MKKQFTFHHDVDGIDYIQDETNGFCFICDELLCSLLNELSIENYRLRQENKYLRLNSKNIPDLLNVLYEENKDLKEILGRILVEVKRDISNSGNTGEITVFIHPDNFDMISELLKKYNRW